MLSHQTRQNARRELLNNRTQREDRGTISSRHKLSNSLDNEMQDKLASSTAFTQLNRERMRHANRYLTCIDMKMCGSTYIHVSSDHYILGKILDTCKLFDQLPDPAGPT